MLDASTQFVMWCLAEQAAGGVTTLNELPTLVGVPTGIAGVVVAIYRFVVKPELDAGRELMRSALSGREKEQLAFAAMGETLKDATKCAQEAAQSAEAAARSNEKTAEAFERQLDRLERIEERSRT